jgi:hypothetical protein
LLIKFFVIVCILANDLVFKHLLESFDISLEEFRHSLDSECCHISTIFDGLYCELFKFKNIVILVLKLVEVDSAVLDIPSNLLFGLFDGIFISFVENLEEFRVNLEIIFTDLEMLVSSGALLGDF